MPVSNGHTPAVPSPELPSRTVTLVLTDGNGEVLGALTPFDVPSPWWPEAAPVVRAARERHGIEPIILRLLEAPARWPGGAVTYLAEVDPAELPADLPLAAWQTELGDHPLRLPWARPGGPTADMAWAERTLAAKGIPLAGRPEQVRTWNLSSLWRLPTATEGAWFKSVPPFFEHEGSMLELLRGGRVPRLIAHEGRRMLLHEITGEDLHEPSRLQLLRMVEQLVELQAAWPGRIDQLLWLGLPDWRAPALAVAIRDVIAREAGPLSRAENGLLDVFAARLEERLARVAECGLPDTLVHGDFHPGNHRGSGTDIVLLDWGDSGVGQPLLDQPAFLERVPTERVRAVRSHWLALWRSALPGSDPERAAVLLAPVAAARQAVIYRKFLDNIEPSEQPYHRNDPADWLRRTAVLLADED